MKKVLFTSALLVSLIGSAQTRVNFTAGMNVSNLTSDLISEYGFDDFREAYIALGGSATSEVRNSVRVGFYISALADFYLNESMFIRSGLKFQNTGDSYYFSTNDVVLVSGNTETDERYKWRQRLGYLSIPVNIGKLASDKVTLYGGLTPSLNVANITKLNYFEADGDDVKIKWEKGDTYEPRNMLVFLNGGMNFLFPGGSVEYFFDLGFNYSLSSVYDDPAGGDLNSANAWQFDIGFGVRL